MQRRTDIEGLRAVAVLLVLLFHAGVPGLDGGYVGVDVFFVISGYLITTLMVNERDESGRISLPRFYARRIRRILPMASLVAVTTLVGSWIWLEPLRLRALAIDVLASAGFASNFVFASRGADYLQSTLPPSPMQHFWSLAVEEQFYVVWPAVVTLVCVGAARGRSASVRMRVMFLSGVTAVGSFTWCMSLMGSSQVLAFYRPHTRAFELAAGAFLATVPVVERGWVRATESLFAWGGLVAIVVSAVSFDETTRFPGPWALLPVAGTVLLVRGGDSTNWAPDAVLKVEPAQWLGSRSYSAYLWHWPVLVIATAAVGRELGVGLGLVCIAMALALAELSYRFVENPVRRRHDLAGVRAFALAAVLLLVVAAVGTVARANPPALSSGPAVTEPVLVVSDTTAVAPTDTSLPVGDTAVADTAQVPTQTAPTLPTDTTPIQPVLDALYGTRVPSNLEPSLTGALGDQPVIYENDCHANFSTVQPKDCVFGDPASAEVIGLYGDSHAAQWFPALEKVTIKHKWKLVTYTKRGCPPAEIEVYSKVLGKVYTECGPWRRNVLAKMKADGVKVVFVAAFDRLLDASTRIPVWQKPWREGLQSTFDALRAAGITPVLIEDTPYPNQDVPTCLSKNRSSVTGCNVTVTVGFRPDLVEMRADFAREGVPVLRTRQWFCSDTQCPVIVGNKLVYRDDNHMTVTWSRFIAPLLDAAVVPFVDWYSRPG